MEELESKSQQKIMVYLRSLGYFVEKVESSSSGGFPDLYCLKNGRHFLIESKRPGEEASKLQEWKHKQIRAHGGQVYVMSRVQECKMLIKE